MNKDIIGEFGHYQSVQRVTSATVRAAESYFATTSHDDFDIETGIIVFTHTTAEARDLNEARLCYEGNKSSSNDKQRIPK